MLAGVAAIDSSTGAVTVRDVVPGILPDVAEIFFLPATSVVAKPEMLTVATVIVLEAHMTLAVRSCVVPSEYVRFGELFSVTGGDGIRRWRNSDRRQAG